MSEFVDGLLHALYPPVVVNPLRYIHLNGSFLLASLAILFNPTFWNIVAQNEYRRHTIERVVKSPYLGCYLLAVTIFSLGIARDRLYSVALDHQPVYPYLDYGEIKVLAALLFLWGGTLVVTSLWALGVTGTYLGDYFGILMKSQVTSFPFSVTDHPMYLGSTLCFLATALWHAKVAGLVLTAQVYLEYLIAEIYFEGPFTQKIYAAAANGSASPRRRARKQLEDKST